MQKTIFAVLMLTVILPTMSVGQISTQEISKQLSVSANEISKNLPTQIDKDTRLDAVVAFDTTMTFTYTLINLSIDNVSQDMKNFLQTQAVNGYCTAMGDGKSYRDNNITLKLNYRANDGKFITVVSVNKSNCNLTTTSP